MKCLLIFQKNKKILLSKTYRQALDSAVTWYFFIMVFSLKIENLFSELNNHETRFGTPWIFVINNTFSAEATLCCLWEVFVAFNLAGNLDAWYPIIYGKIMSN